ncbi:hypothetical protein [Sphingopyxis sp. NFH-91]|jgi:hypothetical protein|uniref:hypothetical protein n=1 Tax=Sphingopyxis sp. NFH-91 TaxID=2744457 RepID=UPI001F433AD1|nr:hypothetical protein [Sphingopyxis sp. NFH-91]
MAFRELKRYDGRQRGLLQDWEAWLEQADKLYDRFLGDVGDSPFLFHEVASVGFLASAAAMAGFVPLAEYAVIKRGRNDKRTRVDGRADLWISSGSRSYSFECKRAYFSATRKNLGNMLEHAKKDIACIQGDESHYAAGCVLARVRDAKRIDLYEQFAQSDEVDLAYHIGPEGEEGAYIYFSLA